MHINDILIDIVMACSISQTKKMCVYTLSAFKMLLAYIKTNKKKNLCMPSVDLSKQDRRKKN